MVLGLSVHEQVYGDKDKSVRIHMCVHGHVPCDLAGAVGPCNHISGLVIFHCNPGAPKV